MTRPADTVLASAARAARKRGMTAHEALRIVAQEYGACLSDKGNIIGWVKPEDEREVRKLPTTKVQEPVPSDGKEDNK